MLIEVKDDGPEPSKRSLVLAVLVLEGGTANRGMVVTDVEATDAALTQLVAEGLADVVGDEAVATLTAAQWQALAVGLAGATWNLADNNLDPWGGTTVVAQVIEQVLPPPK